MKDNKWTWISIAKDTFLEDFSTFLTANDLGKDDFIEIKEKENTNYRFFVYKTL